MLLHIQFQYAAICYYKDNVSYRPFQALGQMLKKNTKNNAFILGAPNPFKVMIDT